MSVIRQKSKSQNGCFKKTKHAKFSEMNIFYPLLCTRSCAYQGVKDIHFLENLAWFVFLKHLFWDSPFCLITEDLELQQNDCWYFLPYIHPYNHHFSMFYMKKNCLGVLHSHLHQGIVLDPLGDLHPPPLPDSLLQSPLTWPKTDAPIFFLHYPLLGLWNLLLLQIYK